MVFQMSISPSGALLATIDVSGRLSLWDLPSFRLKREWSPQELVCVVHDSTVMEKENVFLVLKAYGVCALKPTVCVA